MPKSKNRKGHSQKVESRRKKAADAKQKMSKMQREFIMNLINKEKESGAYENTQNLDSLMNATVIEGPVI